jgi:hypothetical protein
VIAVITLVFKFINIRHAKKAGLSELQYWKDHHQKETENK